MANKRKPDSQLPAEESDQLLIRPLYVKNILFILKNTSIVCSRGAGQEVGRSCIMLEFKGKKIMVQ